MKRTLGDSDPMQDLFAAIVEDDLGKATELVQKQPQLATRLIINPICERRLPHWIYAKDTTLHVAAAGYRIEIAKMLLKAGADPNAAGNHRRSGPLHYAADGHVNSELWNEKRQVAMIRLLLNGGAKIDAQDKNGATSLHRAVRTRCAAAVKCLLDAGADPTIKNKPGSTPFHLAAQNTGRGGSGADKAKAAQREILRAFLAHGISPKLQDTRGRSVSDWARSDWIQEMLRT